MTVSANIRYSKQLPGGAWKGLELSVEAALEGQDTWTEAQATLYDELGACPIFPGKMASDGVANKGVTG